MAPRRSARFPARSRPKAAPPTLPLDELEDVVRLLCEDCNRHQQDQRNITLYILDYQNHIFNLAVLCCVLCACVFAAARHQHPPFHDVDPWGYVGALLWLDWLFFSNYFWLYRRPMFI